jgi:hypothetical protein
VRLSAIVCEKMAIEAISAESHEKKLEKIPSYSIMDKIRIIKKTKIDVNIE